MAIIVGVKFRTSGKVYYFDPGEYSVKFEDNVIVETARGIEYGLVMFSPRQIDDENLKQPLKPVIRIATAEDEVQESENRQKEAEAYDICKGLIKKHELEMKLISCEYTFDRSKVLFYFTADGRIDFRELVKDLAGVFKTRIELRQVGVRDETKLLGGIGVCGRELCCATYLHDFQPVSIRMAKDQSLSLNQSKISGTCGRLMCCLKNEQDTYEYLHSNLPKKGDVVTTPDGDRGEVQSVDVLRQKVKVMIEIDDDEREILEFPVDELKFKRYRHKDNDTENVEKKSGEDKHEDKPDDRMANFGVFNVVEIEEEELDIVEDDYMEGYDLSKYYGDETDGTPIDDVKTESGTADSRRNDGAFEGRGDGMSSGNTADDGEAETLPEGNAKADENAGNKGGRRRSRNHRRNRTNKPSKEGAAAENAEALENEKKKASSNKPEKNKEKIGRHRSNKNRQKKPAEKTNAEQPAKETAKAAKSPEKGNGMFGSAVSDPDKRKRRRRPHHKGAGNKSAGGENANA